MIEWVMVRGYDEAHRRSDSSHPGSVTSSGHGSSSDQSCPDVWTESRYQVFRRITDNANAAMLHYGVCKCTTIRPEVFNSTCQILNYYIKSLAIDSRIKMI